STLEGACIELNEPHYGRRWLYGEGKPKLLFTENETNCRRLYGTANPAACVKDGIHDYVIHGEQSAIFAEPKGTKAAAHYSLTLGPGQNAVIRLRLTDRNLAEE